MGAALAAIVASFAVPSGAGASQEPWKCENPTVRFAYGPTVADREWRPASWMFVTTCPGTSDIIVETGFEDQGATPRCPNGYAGGEGNGAAFAWAATRAVAHRSSDGYYRLTDAAHDAFPYDKYGTRAWRDQGLSSGTWSLDGYFTDSGQFIATVSVKGQFALDQAGEEQDSDCLGQEFQLGPVELKAGGRSGEAAMELARTYRPYLYFDSKEPYRPLTVNAFAEEGVHQTCNLRTRLPDDCQRVHSVGDITERQDALDVKGENRGGTDARAPDDVLRSCNAPAALRDCPGGSRSAIYVHEDSDTNYTFLDYWFFYRFNITASDLPVLCRGIAPVEESTCFDHEGDWEGLTVALRRTEPREPEFVVYAAHHNLFRYLWASLERANAVVGNHPMAFVAFGSHASYPLLCSGHCKQDDTFAGFQIPEGRHDGKSPWLNNDDATCALAPCVRGFSAANAWANWGGRWGRKVTNASLGGVRGPGPSSPATSVRYKDHYAGQELPATRSAAAAPATAVRAKCKQWFGPGVRVAACRGTSAPEIAQSLGKPLTPKATFDLPQAIREGSEMHLRVKLPDGRIAEPQFTAPVAIGAKADLRLASVTAKRAALRLPSGKQIKGRVPTPAPQSVRKLKADRRASRVTVRFVATSASSQIVVVDRRGRVLSRRNLRTRAGRTTTARLAASVKATKVVVTARAGRRASVPALVRIKSIG